MPCPSIVEVLRQCGGDLIQAGIKKLYAISYNDLVNIQNTDEVYATTGGLISEINLASGKTFVQIGLIKNTSGLATDFTKDRLTQSGSVKQTFTLVLSGMTAENKTFIESVMTQPVALMFKINNGKYFAIGLNGDLELDSATGGTGVTDAELQGYTLTFSGTDNKLTMMVDPTIVPELIAL